MSTSPPTDYFITGSNRGIGLALVKELVKRPNVYLFAGCRSTSPALDEIISNNPDKISFVPYVAADEGSNRAAAKVVSDRFGKVDVVLGVAAIGDYLGRVDETPAFHLEEHFKVNVTGILILFQAFIELLRKSDAPKFIPFTSAAGSLTSHISAPIGQTCYGASKVALNYLSRKIHFENEWLVCFPLAPGVVHTDMSSSYRTLDKSGSMAHLVDAAGVSADVAGTMIVAILDSATRETLGGEFINLDETKLPW